jgi:hypothetical protein
VTGGTRRRLLRPHFQKGTCTNYTLAAVVSRRVHGKMYMSSRLRLQPAGIWYAVPMLFFYHPLRDSAPAGSTKLTRVVCSGGS